AFLQAAQLLDKVAHVRLAGDIHGYFRGRKPAGDIRTDATFGTILPWALEAVSRLRPKVEGVSGFSFCSSGAIGSFPRSRMNASQLLA
ncbi:MAG TPA: hypothetical protein VME43_09900, partial [Bryobacteraceae bacterium]|nr:hypothetical protein [Bryobacteraceae bacterium]